MFLMILTNNFFCPTKRTLRLDLQHQLRDPSCQYALNPAVNMTWQDEDFIGRIARVSRRCHTATTASRTTDRCLGLYRRQWMSNFDDCYKDPPVTT